MMYGTWQRRKGTLGSYAINKKNIAKSNGEVNFLNNKKKKKDSGSWGKFCKR